MATNTRKKTQSTEPAKPPVAKLRLGLINASIWERVTEKGTFHSVTFERRYRDAEGNWHSTHSYEASDLLLLAKLSGDWLSLRFVLFALVGASGLIVHLWALRQGLVLGLDFDWAQTLAAYVAMTSNFALNNQLTYRDRRLRGLSALKGLLIF